MKGSKEFKESIKDYLRDEAKKDPLFLKTLKKENKNIDDCLTYIFNKVKDSGRVGFAEKEIYKLAKHYYDEDDIEVGTAVTGGHVVTNRAIELSEEDIAELKAKAKEEFLKEELAKIKAKNKPAKPAAKTDSKTPGVEVTPQLF